MILERYGIIDIGSNSIRLVIYEKTENGAYRVIDGNKRAARLSSKINEQGELTALGIQELIEILHIFIIQMEHHHITKKIAVATAAIRNSTNKNQILRAVKEATGLTITVFSGQEEAEYGFIGMVNSLPIENGFLIDIGGGSSEITLFKDREIVASHSFSLGCVNLNKQFDSKNGLSPQESEKMQQHIYDQFNSINWLKSNAHLPLICLGGTARAFAKIHQADNDYPFKQTHHYMINALEADQLYDQLCQVNFEQRKKVDGLSKDRVDVIIPGLTILTCAFKYLQCTHYIICGAGLRDGIFFKLLFEDKPVLDHPLQFSIGNLLALHNDVPKVHINQVTSIALRLFDTLKESLRLTNSHRHLLHIASQLYRIGGAIEYYDYNDHTFYIIAHSRIHGLAHRDILSIAAVASYKSKGRLKSQLKPYGQLIAESELHLLNQLGVILLIALALDRSETQGLQEYNLHLTKGALHIEVTKAKHHLIIEQSHLESLKADCKKALGIQVILNRKN